MTEEVKTMTLEDCFKLTKGDVVPNSEFRSVTGADLNEAKLFILKRMALLLF